MIVHLLEAWQVFLIYLIPFGGGIPAGLVLAQSRGVAWYESMVLYFFSDVVQAFVIEIIIVLFVFFAQYSVFLARIVAAFRESTRVIVARYSLRPSRFALVMISFGVDPITGRSVALAAGHGFISGWGVAIAGDMIFFSVIMASTYALNGLLGDGTMTALIVTAAIFLLPPLYRQIRDRLGRAR